MFGEHTSDLDSQLSLVIFTLTPSASYQFTGVEMEAESGAHGHTSIWVRGFIPVHKNWRHTTQIQGGQHG